MPLHGMSHGETLRKGENGDSAHNRIDRDGLCWLKGEPNEPINCRQGGDEKNQRKK